MASSKEYAAFVEERCEGLSVRPMMGEYVLYFHDKIVGGIYDDRLLIKPTPSAKMLMPHAEYQVPYDGAKEMLFVDNIDDGEFLLRLFKATYDELPAPKKKLRQYK